MLTLSAAKQARRLKNISGLCPGSQEFTDALNDVVDVFLRRGNFWNSVKRVQGCVYDDCIVWSRHVGSVLAMNRCNHSIPPKNMWFEFNDVLPEHVRRHNRGCFGNMALVDGNTVSVFNQIPCLNSRYIRFYIDQPSDIGKTITIFGIDDNGQVITSTHPDGTFQEGVVLTLGTPFVQTSFLVRRVDRIVKDPTTSLVRGYQFDGATLYNLATYEASETLPEYRSNRIEGHHWPVVGGQPTGCCPRQVEALVKLKFIPAVHDDDLIVIDNLEALALGMQSINQSDAYDHDGAEKAMLRAIHSLNLDLRNKLQLDSTPAKVEYYGTAKLNRVFGGMFR